MSEKKISFWHPASLICTCFGVGKIPFAPGTWGSLFGFPVLGFIAFISLLIADILFPEAGNVYSPTLDGKMPIDSDIYSYHELIFLGLTFLLMFLIFMVGWKCSNIYESLSGKHDSKEIVIDEVVGQALAASLAIIIDGYFLGANAKPIEVLLVTFITFRIFDIVKRGPVGWVDRNVKGGLGVMLDDVVAGILAGVTSALIFILI